MADSQSQYSKARIIKLNKDGSKTEDEYEVMFNPKELTFTKTNQWKPGVVPARNAPDVEFSGGNPASLKLQLFFDTYSTGEDVRSKHIDDLYALMMVDDDLVDTKNEKGRPPLVRFQWGQIGFNGVIISISQRFTLFLPTGIPVRAVLDISLQQYEDNLYYPPSNPTSGGRGGERIWTVKTGDTLQWIAYSEYGDTGQWRHIAEANHLTQVRQLTTGTSLIIPRL
jgi:hypothetical protein